MLYSYFLAKTKASKDKSFILVEGYLDAILMHQYGYQNTVATLGTACSKEQLVMMSRSADNLIVMYDADSAGIGAALKMVELSFDSALNIFVAVLDAGVDPADQLQTNPGKMKDLASSKLGLLEFFISRLSEDFFALSNVKKLERLKKILLVAAKIVDPIKRYLILQKISHLTGVKYSMLESQIGVGALSSVNIMASSRINHSEKYSQEEMVFFLELIERSKRNKAAFVLPEYYIIFSEKISAFFILLDKILGQGISIDLISSFEQAILEDQRPWLLDGLMYFETSFEAKKINCLLEKLFLQYSKDVLRNCCRTSNLGIDLEERVKINQILTSIKSISILMKERENV
jgi:5S rRNA maturation endonuclease (ribonuclease M5)